MGKDSRNYKYYQYRCETCGYDCSMDDYWIAEHVLSREQGCSCCSGRKVIKGINDIATTNPEMFNMLTDKEFGYTHLQGTADSTEMACPYCGYKKIVRPFKVIEAGFSCPNCSDRISFPEKFMISVLKQTNVDFIYQATRRHFDWIKGKCQYDFYLPEYNTIIETHGEQHYTDTSSSAWNKAQNNDGQKQEIALANGIDNYIIIDCRKSKRNFIKKSIYESKLAELLNLDKVDWIKAETEAHTNFFIKICQEYKERYPNITIAILSKEYNLCTGTVYKYLKAGTEIGIVDYNASEERKRILKEYESDPILCIYKNQQYAFYNKKTFFKWVQKTFNINYNIELARYIGKYDYKGCKIFNITKEQFNEYYNQDNIITYGEPFILLSA